MNLEQFIEGLTSTIERANERRSSFDGHAVEVSNYGDTLEVMLVDENTEQVVKTFVLTISDK